MNIISTVRCSIESIPHPTRRSIHHPYTVAAVENATFHILILLNLSTIFSTKNFTYFHIFLALILLLLWSYFAVKTYTFLYGIFVSKCIHFAIGINNGWVCYLSTFLWQSMKEKYIMVDLPIFCLSSLMWWFGQIMIFKYSSIEKERNIWTKK